MKLQAKTDVAKATVAASGTVIVEAKAHIFRKGESNGFCEWFGCELISVMGLVHGKNLIELHYGGKETVFVGFDAMEKGKVLAFTFGGVEEFLECTKLDKVCRFVFYNCNGVLSTKLIE